MAAQTDPERMKRRSKDSSETSSITSRELIYLSNSGFSLISKLLLCYLHCYAVL